MRRRDCLAFAGYNESTEIRMVLEVFCLRPRENKAIICKSKEEACHLQRGGAFLPASRGRH